MRIEAKAATRIDLAGGTLDLWPLYLFVGGGITINVAINLYATAALTPLEGTRIEIVSRDQRINVAAADLPSLPAEPLPLLCRLARYFAPRGGFRLETAAQAPAGSGLGGSSTLAIAVSGAFNEWTSLGASIEDLIGICRDVEAQVLEIPTGEQDYYAAACGGFSAWHFEINRVRRELYAIPLSDLNERLLLFYSGLPRSSGINNWQVFRQYVDGDLHTRRLLASIAEQSRRLHSALLKSDWDECCAAIAAEWEARKQLAPGITTPDIEAILAFGRERGAKAGKVCGAGGGGCVFLMMDPDRKKEMAAEAQRQGFQVLEFETVRDGLTVTQL